MDGATFKAKDELSTGASIALQGHVLSSWWSFDCGHKIGGKMGRDWCALTPLGPKLSMVMKLSFAMHAMKSNFVS